MPDLGQPVATGPIIAIEGKLVGPEEVRAYFEGPRAEPIAPDPVAIVTGPTATAA